MHSASAANRALALDVHGVKVRFECHVPDVLPLLTLDYGRFFAPVDTEHGDFDLNVVSVPRPLLSDPSGFVAGAGNSLVHSTQSSVTVACAHERADPAYYTEIRPYLTSIISRHLIRTRSTFMLHASGTANAKGEATLYVGEAGAGKTTTALTQISNGDAYVSNDLVFLSAENGNARVLAMPQPPMLGVGTAVALKQLLPEFASEHLVADTAGKSPQDLLRYMPGEKVSIDPRALLPASLQTTLKFIIFPQPDFDLSAPMIVRMGPTEAALRLLQQAIFPIKPGLPLESTHGTMIKDLMAVIDSAIGAAESYSFRWCSDPKVNASALKTLISAGVA